MTSLLPPVSIIHIKGHQDDLVKKHQLPLPAQLNMEADQLAGKYQRNTTIIDRAIVVQ